MADKDKLVPRTPNEVVVPIGKANLVTTQEEVDEALETASHIFREQNEEQEMEISELAKAVGAEVELDSEGNEVIRTKGEQTQKVLDLIDPSDEELVELTPEEVAALPKAKFGRDNYGRALNKNGTPRKARNDKGVVRGKYGPRKPKADPVETESTPTPVATAAERADSNIF